MSVLNKIYNAKMTYEEVEADLSGVTYSSAISHYNLLHQSFLAQYSIAAQQTMEESEKLIEDTMIAEINASPIEGQLEKSAELFSAIRDAVVAKLAGNNELASLATKFRQENRNKKQASTAAFKEYANKVLSEQELYRMVIQSLTSKSGNIAAAGFSIQDILNQVRGYRNRVLLTRSNASAKHFITSSKGYMREALVHKAASSLAAHLQGYVPTMHAGSKTNEAGLDTVYDEWLDFLNDPNLSFNAEISESKINTTGFGFQVKSWVAPWESSTPSWSFSMGSHANLLLKFQEAAYLPTHNWREGVKFLEPFVIEAIGPAQVGFITGSRFYWTEQLIENFINYKYYYAFKFDKEHKATKATSWQQINMDA